MPKDVEPVFHWSEGKEDKMRSHRDYYTDNFLSTNGISFYQMGM